MVIKQRAMAVEDKEERRNALLDAAEDLFLEHPERIANVAQVAEAAGLAKGTVYLYFPGKEEMMLALHERHMAHFFRELLNLLEGPAIAGFEEVFAVTSRHLLRAPGYLPLTSRCFGLMDSEIPLESAIAFKVRIAQTLARAGEGLERHFPALGPGGGATLLQHSYGMIVGLWQLMHPNERLGKALDRPEMKVLKRDYEHEIETALRALWAGSMANATASKRKPR